MSHLTSASQNRGGAVRAVVPQKSRRFLNARGGVADLSFLILFVFLLAGWLRREPPPDLVIINGNEPESLDPAIVTGISEMRLTKGLFEGLLRLNGKTARPEAALAESWEISPDGKVYTFHLRDTAVWSTGEPITT